MNRSFLFVATKPNKNAMKRIIIILFLTFGICAIQSKAQSPKEHTNKDKKNVAIQGYDPVSYFMDSKPIAGDNKITTEYNGVTYRFKSNKNRDLFMKAPMKYEPQYGGWCAYAMGVDGSKVKIDPETFKILDDKLYLFYNFYFTNTLPKWNDDEIGLKAKADEYWDKLVK